MKRIIFAAAHRVKIIVLLFYPRQSKLRQRCSRIMSILKNKVNTQIALKSDKPQQI